MKDNIIPELINSILDYICKERLYFDLKDKDELLKKPFHELEEELKIIIEKFLKNFAEKNNFSSADIVQCGITFVNVERQFVQVIKKEPYFFHFITEENNGEFKKWLIGYKKIDLKINELLCDKDHISKWALHKFPMIIVYSNKKPYFLKYENDNAFYPLLLEESNYNYIFNPYPEADKEKKFKDDLLELQDQFINKESYSSFKIFFTSNFEGLRAQTFIKFKEPIIDIQNKQELQEFIKLCFLIDKVIGGYIYNFEDIIYQHQYTKQILEYSKKAAIASIMARNMSHNIGSHVLWHLAEDYKKIENDMETIYEKTFYIYLRERMGFIALIATATPTWAMETDFKNAMIPFLLERIKDQSDNVIGLTYLLNNIVKTEDIKIEDKTYKFLPRVQLSSEIKELKIDFPHGSYGIHAFYTIIENIIRNTIKHNLSAFVLGIDQTITVNFTITVNDPSVEEWKNDYYKVTITDNLKNYSEPLNSLIHKLNKKAEEEIFDETGRRRTTNLGFKEKRICAAFLRMIPQEKIDSEELKIIINEREIPPLLNIDKKDGHLVHEIYMLKPKQVLIATDNQSLLNIDNKGQLKRAGIDIINKDQFLEKRITYKFLIIDFREKEKGKEFDYSKLIESSAIKYPFRIFIPCSQRVSYASFKIGHLDLTASMIENPDSFYANLWKEWIRQCFSKDYYNKKMVFNGDRKIHQCYSDITETFSTLNKNHIYILHNPNINQEIFDTVFRCETYSSTLYLGEIITALADNCAIGFQLYESFLWKIAIIDERIFKEKGDKISLNKWDITPSLYELWLKRGVGIFDHYKVIKDDWSEITSFEPDILIIHQGVIDKFPCFKKEEKDIFFKKWNDTIRNKIPYIIITSDRGEPDYLDKLGARWLQFSDLADVLIHKADKDNAKFLLTKLLTSLRGK